MFRNFTQRKVIRYGRNISDLQEVNVGSSSTSSNTDEGENTNKIHSLIPLNLFQTWHTLDLPNDMEKNVELLKHQNPEFKYFLFDDKMCRDFIEDNFSCDTVWAFDKLKPGAYKADLWRYCVLYIHGGIYLDIKFKCINGFKLIELTDKEYWVKDRKATDINGIYQALLITFPKNEILWNCIQDIIRNCKNNTFSVNPLIISGPSLIGRYFNEVQYKRMNLLNNGDEIVHQNNPILTHYSQYRNEQHKNQNEKHYSILWNERNVYNYTILKEKLRREFTNSIEEDGSTFYSSNIFIMESIDSSKYLVCRRWINYRYDKIFGYKSNIQKQYKSLTSKFYLDSKFDTITNEDEYFLEDECYKRSDFLQQWSIGHEDMRILYFDRKLYTICTVNNPENKLPAMSSDIFQSENEMKTLKPNIIKPSFYGNNKTVEKNWSFVNYKNQLYVVYNWYPLQLGTINYDIKQLDIVEVKYNMPTYFQDARGGSPGYNYSQEIWFILHKSQRFAKSKNIHFHYQHFFAVFDSNMNYLRSSELFKLGEHPIEFCTGLIIKNNEIILSYGLEDTKSIIAVYDKSYVENEIKWF